MEVVTGHFLAAGRWDMKGTAEISAAVTDEIASWKRVFANRANGVDARALLRNAARELWSVLAIDATVHPEMKGVAHQGNCRCAA